MDKNNLENIWKDVLKIVEKKIENTRAFDIWIKPVKVFSLSDNILTIEIPNLSFQKGFLSFVEIIKKGFFEITGILPEIEFVYPEKEKGQIGTVETILNNDYTFENFVVGPCNRLPHAAALAVAQSPGTAYNPLFLYGGVGLGKTHLMQAIGHFIMENNDVKISYVPCEIFVNQFIYGIQNKTIHLFRNKYRNLDVLLIDDIHFIAGKEGTQEEFFHTFNTLYDQKKQIILSSDRPPKEISFLEKRLISRFEWGLVVDFQPPDFETRVAILKKKCEIKKIQLPDNIVFFIAEKIKDNIRLLEGVLNRLIAYSSLLNMEITMDLTDEVLKGVYYKEKRIITLPLIIEKVCDFFHLTQNELISKKRIKSILIPRQIAMYLARELTNSSLTSIAESCGGKDHTTVIHAYKKIKNEIQKNEYLNNVVSRIKKNLEENE